MVFIIGNGGFRVPLLLVSKWWEKGALVMRNDEESPTIS